MPSLMLFSATPMIEPRAGGLEARAVQLSYAARPS